MSQESIHCKCWICKSLFVSGTQEIHCNDCKDLKIDLAPERVDSILDAHLNSDPWSFTGYEVQRWDSFNRDMKNSPSSLKESDRFTYFLGFDAAIEETSKRENDQVIAYSELEMKFLKLEVKLDKAEAKLKSAQYGLGLAEAAIEALALTQKEEGMGLLGSFLIVPHTLGQIRDIMKLLSEKLS